MNTLQNDLMAFIDKIIRPQRTKVYPDISRRAIYGILPHQKAGPFKNMELTVLLCGGIIMRWYR